MIIRRIYAKFIPWILTDDLSGVGLTMQLLFHQIQIYFQELLLMMKVGAFSMIQIAFSANPWIRRVLKKHASRAHILRPGWE